MKTPPSILQPTLLRRGALVAWLALALTAAACDAEDEPREDTSNNADVLCADDLDCPAGRFCIEGTCLAEGAECFSDGECAEPGEVCRGGYCTAPVPQCAEDSECGDGMICEDATCREGCRDDDACDDGDVCDLERLRCAAPTLLCEEPCPPHTACDTRTGECEPDGTCALDSDCAGELVCEGGRCIAPVESCDSNVDCDLGTICDPDSATCVPGCRASNECPEISQVCFQGMCGPPPACEADSAEPNDAREEASPLIGDATLTGQTFCSNEDWYSFRAFANDMVTVELGFDHDAGDLSLQLVDPEGSVLQLSATMADTERIQRAVNQTGTHYLRVFAPGRGVYTSYDLALTRVRSCAADRLEENDTAALASPLLQADGTLENLTVCFEDDDWYALPLFPGETLDASISFTSAEGDLSLELYDDAGATLLTSSATDADTEAVTWEARGSEIVRLRVPGGEELVNLYALTTAITPRACTQEAPEIGGDTAAAAPLTPGVPVSGAICSGDADWFSFVTPSDVTLQLTLAHDAQEGDLNLEVFGPDGQTILADATSTDDDETLELSPQVPGTLWVRVFGAGRSQADYTLTLESDATAACPADDAAEDNDAINDATPIQPGVQRDRILCADDEDWYSFTLAEGQSFQLFALAPAELGTLSVQLYDPTGAPAGDAATGAAPVKRVQQQLGAPAGTWSVQLSGDQGDAVPYALRLFVYDGRLPLECPDDDTFEDNDRPADAPALAFNTTTEAILCPGDAGGDWFRLNAAAGDAINLRLDHLHADANLDLLLFDGTGAQVLATADSMTDHEGLRFVAPTSGLLFAQVVLNGESLGGAVYGLTASRGATNTRPTCATDDLYEQNDTPATAALVTPGPIAALRCGTDVDLFALEVDPNTTLRATLLHDGAADALDLALLDTTGAELAAAPATGDSSRTLLYDTSVGERLLWRVSGAAPGDAAYTLLLEVVPALDACGADDSLEPNDVPALATEASADTAWANLAACGQDQDWWRLTVAEDLQAVVEATFDGDLGNLDLAALNTRGDGVAESFGTSGVERLVLPAEDGDAVYWVRAFRPDASTDDLPYSLSVRYEETRLACFEDEFEPNNSDAEAADVTTTTYNLGFCAGDTDWFIITVGMFESATARIEFDGDAADLGVEVIDPALPIFPNLSDELNADVEEATGISFLGGPLLIRVFSTDPEASAPYTLTVEVGSGF